MSRQQAIAQYTRILSRWPIDRIRPENVHFQRILQKRIDDTSSASSNDDAQIKAADLLLGNALSKRYPLSQTFMQPASQPEHYERLRQELDEAPGRSWLGRIGKRLQSMVKFR